MPIIVIEGADGCGKSTLAEVCALEARLQGFSDVRLEHYGVPKYDPESSLTIGEQAMNQLIERFQGEENLKPDTFLVLDRFHWGEPAYAPVFRPELCVHPLLGTLQNHEFTYVNGWLTKLGAEQVYIENDLDTMIERLGLRGEEALLSDDAEKRVAQLLAIKSNYEDLITWLESLSTIAPVRRERLQTARDSEKLAVDLVWRASIQAGKMFAPELFQEVSA